MAKNNWLIWSFERGAWWKPASRGYTQDKNEAGRYSFDKAKRIVTDANVCNLEEAMIEEDYAEADNTEGA